MSGGRPLRYSSVRQRGDVRKWKDKLIDVPAFVLGNGPSLNDEDVASLSSYFTIGINRSFKKLDSTILMWQDLGLWYTERHEVVETKAIKFCTAVGDPENRFAHFRLEAGPFALPQSVDVLHGHGASGPLAIQLAYILGCNPIIILGSDCKHRGSDTDFYGVNRFHSPNTMPQCVAGLQWARTEVHDKGIRKIISCSDNDYFERKPLAEVVASLDQKHKQSREYWNQFLV